jgi:hypothetical protein
VAIKIHTAANKYDQRGEENPGSKKVADQVFELLIGHIFPAMPL